MHQCLYRTGNQGSLSFEAEIVCDHNGFLDSGFVWLDGSSPFGLVDDTVHKIERSV